MWRPGKLSSPTAASGVATQHHALAAPSTSLFACPPSRPARCIATARMGLLVAVNVAVNIAVNRRPVLHRCFVILKILRFQRRPDRLKPQGRLIEVEAIGEIVRPGIRVSVPGPYRRQAKHILD